MPTILLRCIKIVLLLCLLSFIAFFGIILYALTASLLTSVTAMADYIGIAFSLIISLGLLICIIRYYRRMVSD
ncbi:hypothetical protein [Pectinatus cerevisiiphilus]|uniref:Uncharacterized protein n=1 Tax=Pectinatus cerevisiiphilus TaxID=86956 RepID=A0A4R3K1G5_9FIRM|nr:hypothetical protein [Pectinatus cerevisiiphilus]TCS75383.1 hypothetical protein EDC37_1323 [Pectinatus cerevisiiphilus]